jgi:putative phosphoesterase
MMEAFDKQIKKPDAVIFLGDGLRDFSYCEFDGVTLFAVNGNCDCFGEYGSLQPLPELEITLGGKKIFAAHGHKYNVKFGYEAIVAEGARRGADIVLFGHTHNAHAEYLPAGETDYGVTLEKPMYLMNPGSIGEYYPSFGCIEINKAGQVILSHGNL